MTRLAYYQSLRSRLARATGDPNLTDDQHETFVSAFDVINDVIQDIQEPSSHYCADCNRTYDGPRCPGAHAWAMRSVGCHWTHPDYPKAVISTVVGQDGTGYEATVAFERLGMFDSLADAQNAIENSSKA